jgi:hypothetical protein
MGGTISKICHLKPSMYFQEALDVEPPYDVCGAAVAQLRTKRERRDADVEHLDREHGGDGIRALVGAVDEGVLRDGVAMGDLRGLGEAGHAGEEECRCCVFGLGRRGEARPEGGTVG